jgi:putative phosphoesterase
MVFGVIADTQGVLTPAQLAGLKKAFKGVDGILHAGPVGDLRVVEQLGTLAPVKAVSGNTESSIVRSELYIRMSLKVDPLRIGLMHGYAKPQTLKSFLLKQFEEDPVDVIVYGSNFEPYARQLGPVYFFNPGSFLGTLPEGQKGKGPSRVGLLFIRGKKIDGQPGIVVK